MGIHVAGRHLRICSRASFPTGARMGEQARDRRSPPEPPSFLGDAWGIRHMVLGAAPSATPGLSAHGRVRGPGAARNRPRCSSRLCGGAACASLDRTRSCQCARQRLEFIRNAAVHGLSAGERGMVRRPHIIDSVDEGNVSREVRFRMPPPAMRRGRGAALEKRTQNAASVGRPRIAAGLARGSKRSYFATLSRSRTTSFDRWISTRCKHG
jgi:hypothetical protein